MADTIKVACRIPNGLTLQLYERRFDDGTGQKPQAMIGKPVVIKGPPHGSSAFVITEVDRDFAAKWFEQNPDHPAVLSKAIHAEE